MKYKKILVILLMIFTLSALTACNLFNPLKSITIVGSDSLEIDQTLQLNIETEPINTAVSVNWSSSNIEVVTVDEDGNITGLSKGTVIITATSKTDVNISDTIEIKVVDVTIESISISGLSQVYEGGQITIRHTVNPSHASQEVIYTSSDEVIATVDDSGVITGLSQGQATITITSTVDQSITKDFTVTVIDAPLEVISIEGPNEIDIEGTVLLKSMSNGSDVSSLVNWQSSNEAVATVNSNGQLTALSKGTVTIKASVKKDPTVFSELQIEVKAITHKYYSSKVLVIDEENNNLELLNVPATTYDNETTFLKKVGDSTTPTTIDELYVGMENIYVKVDINTNLITSVLVDGETGFSNIRVGIRKSIADISKDETLYHDSVIFTLNSDVTLQTFDGLDEIVLPSRTTIIASIINDKIVVKTGRDTVFETEKRIILIPDGLNDAIKFASITRNSDELYSGNIEIAIENGRLLVINDINLEKYLYKVVPSEMPASYHVEALKAQAIAARTYAYRDIFNRTYEHLGYTVDDSVKSQVYNNTNPHSNTNAAVDATRGLVMMNNGELISAFYSSTSSGLTASAHEVWITDGIERPEPNPALIGQNLTEDENGNPIPYNYQDESSMLTFFKTIKMYTPDSSVGFHRWKVEFTKTQLANTINTNLKPMYDSSPSLILTETANGWQSLAIPTSIGQVENIYVSERGTSGVVMSVVIETTTGNYKIVNQYNIRFTIRPKDAGTTVTRYYATGDSTNYTNSRTNDSILLSGFFAIETGSNSYTFYGGGNGHGVGMSQNGANGLAKTGSKYDQILTTYYSAIDLIDVSYDYQVIIDYKNLF